MMEVMSGFDIGLSDVPLMLFHGEYEMGFHDIVGNAADAFDAIGGELSKGFRDLDVTSGNVHFHRHPFQEF
jgi:hypothetical protein